MIGFLSGRWHPGADNSGVVITSSGVGYQVRTPTPFPPDSNVDLWVHTVVRENAITLYGFVETGDVDAFAQLLTITGVGPTAALSVLHTAGRHTLARAARAHDVTMLGKMKGVGPKLAARIVTDYRPPASTDMDDEDGSAPSTGVDDVVTLLTNLGFDRDDARAAAQRHINDDEQKMIADALDDLMNRTLSRTAGAAS